MVKFDNIIKFICIFLSGDLKLQHESPDYIMEKFERFFGKNIKIKQHSRTSELYKEHNKIWKHDDYRINTIFNFLIDVLKYSKLSEVDISYKSGKSMYTSAINNIKSEPKIYVELFNSWIGDFSDIHDEDNVGLHPILERDLYNLYLENADEQYSDFFQKLDRKEKLKRLNKIL